MSYQKLIEQTIGVTLVFLLLGACGPSQTELDAQATQIAADIFATQTAKAPLSTNTSGPMNSASTTVFSSTTLGFRLDYPAVWQIKEEALQVVFSPSVDGLDPHNLKDASLWIGAADDNDSTITDMLEDALAGFPPEAETLNEGTISIASQTWTSIQIRFDDEDLGGQGVATLAVTNKDGKGYILVAVAPAERWNSIQPFYQEMINSFRFSLKVIPQASSNIVPPTATSEPSTSAPAIESGTIRVAPDGSGDYPDLKTAVDTVDAGTTLFLEPGTYRLAEPLDIDKSLRLVGSGMDPTEIISEAEGYVARFSGDGLFAVEDITFRHRGTTVVNVVVVQGGEVTFAHCSFSGAVTSQEEDE